MTHYEKTDHSQLNMILQDGRMNGLTVLLSLDDTVLLLNLATTERRALSDE